jgi:hypothetical protein
VFKKRLKKLQLFDLTERPFKSVRVPQVDLLGIIMAGFWNMMVGIIYSKTVRYEWGYVSVVFPSSNG